ncbi:protein HIRA homolog [Hermetia illucens]|nr:protein HIRA homolog [Hermetia illucens]
MKLLKPSWVHHDDKPIFSVDVHQGGLKFATGGQGNDSGRVVIWNLLPVLSEKAEMDSTVPKILCQMDNHLACVNCVRWSQNGLMLASGSDDKLVMIWKMSKGSSGVFGSGGITKNPETWKCISTLRGHAGDVLDLAWSPQDRWLASCSVDNTIIIWDVHALPSMITVLKGHTGLVKGIAWDPVGKFVASQSDDRSVRIWRTSDWTCSNIITEPFEECGGTTHILRLSWSPDGQYLVSAHAMNGGGPTAQIIEREGWKCDKDFVGHRKAVTCVRFHNSILKRQTQKSNKSQQYCCLAVGSRDRSLSVWMTALQRPLVVIHDLFQDSVLDLSWGPDKYILLACSGDGSVACLQFTDKELGTQLSEEDKNALYQRMYGKSATLDVHASPGRDMIIENAELLNITQEKLKPPSVSNTMPHPKTSQPSLNSHFNGEQTTFSVSTPVKAISKQIETRTADGKRRITPMFIPLHQDTGESTEPPELNSTSRNFNSERIEESADHVAEVITNSSKTITPEGQAHLDNRLTKAPYTSSAPARSSAISRSQPSSSQNAQNITERKPTGPTRLNVGQTVKSGGASSSEYVKQVSDFRVHVHNGNVTTTLGPLSKVTCWALGANEKLWETLIGSPIVNFSLCAKYVLLCSQDGTIRFLHIRTGINALPILHLATAATQCAFCPLGVLGGVISECGQLRVWNIEKQAIYITSSCADIFKSGQVVQFTITENGIPFVLFSNGSSYSYSKGMECWMVLNSKDPVIRHGLQSTIPKDFQRNIRTYPIMSIQTASNSFGTNVVDLNTSQWQISAKLSFIENQIKLAEAVKSPEELKYWYLMLGYHLAKHGTEKRIRLLLDDLLGPTYCGESADKSKILNVEKRTLLETVLNIIKLHPQWQRVYMEYSEQLNFITAISKRSSISNDMES